jgi:hypothetical protein
VPGKLSKTSATDSLHLYSIGPKLRMTSIVDECRGPYSLSAMACARAQVDFLELSDFEDLMKTERRYFRSFSRFSQRGALGTARFAR